MAFLNGTVKSARGVEISVDRLPSGRLTRWCAADVRWRRGHQRSGEDHGNGPELAITLNDTEYTTREVHQSGSGDTHRLVATVKLSDEDSVRLSFSSKPKWDLVEPAPKVA